MGFEEWRMGMRLDIVLKRRPIVTPLREVGSQLCSQGACDECSGCAGILIMAFSELTPELEARFWKVGRCFGPMF
jgi:hypothetical protein